MSIPRSSAMALAMLLATAAAAKAGPLLAPASGTLASRRATLPGITHAQRLALDRGALAGLRAQSSTIVSAFPLSASSSVDLALTRFSPFAPGARAEAVAADGVHQVPLPDNAYFTGSVVGEAGSRVVLVAGANEVSGFVVSGGTVYPFGADASGGHLVYALPDADPAVYPPPGDFCANDLHPAEVTPPGAAHLLRDAAPPPTSVITLKVADVAIETDQELRSKFASDQAALNYLASLLAAATAIYERDVSVRLRFSYIRLWDGSPADPWTATATSDALNEVRSYWNNPANDMNAIAGPHDLVHFISGKAVQGGIAYRDVLCNSAFGYGVSQVFGSFNLANPQQIWDVVVVTHELGHNFGSPHSHCYNPPLDHCYNAETGCYAGAVEVSHGTLMSYCHLLSGGLANIDMLFGPVVSARIGTSVAAASCLSSVTVTISTTTTTTSTTSTTLLGATTSTSTSSSTSVPPGSTTSTTNPRSPGDADGDGIPDVLDACPAGPLADLAAAPACAVCRADGPPAGARWGRRG